LKTMTLFKENNQEVEIRVFMPIQLSKYSTGTA
jgi:hypothetical protein